MSMDFVEVGTQVKAFFDAFNIWGAGIMVIWIIMSIFLSRAISEKKDEFVLFMITLLTAGGILFFAKDPSKYILLTIAVVIIIIGLIRMLWKRKQEDD